MKNLLSLLCLAIILIGCTKKSDDPVIIYNGTDCLAPPSGLPRSISYTYNLGGTGTETYNICYDKGGKVTRLISSFDTTYVNYTPLGKLLSIINSPKYNNLKNLYYFRWIDNNLRSIKHTGVSQVYSNIVFNYLSDGRLENRIQTNSGLNTGEKYHYKTGIALPDSAYNVGSIDSGATTYYTYKTYDFLYDAQNRFLRKRIVRPNDTIDDLAVTYDAITFNSWPIELVLALANPDEYATPLKFANINNLYAATPFDFMQLDNNVAAINDYDNNTAGALCPVYTTKFLNKTKDAAGNLKGFKFVYTYKNCNTAEEVYKDVTVSIGY